MKPRALLAGSCVVPFCPVPSSVHHSAVCSGTFFESSQVDEDAVAPASEGFRAGVGSAAQCCNPLGVVGSARAMRASGCLYHSTHAALQMWPFSGGCMSPLSHIYICLPKVPEMYSQARRELQCGLPLPVNRALCVTPMEGSFVLK